MMKRLLNLFIVVIIFFISSSTLRVCAMTLNTDTEEWKNDLYDSDDDDDDDGDGDGDDYTMELTKNYIRVVPGKKKIKRGKSFYIKTAPTFWSGLYDLSDEEWEEIFDCSINGIFYCSINPKVASVNKKTGKVTGHRKGSTVIKTTICFVDGSEGTYKTKVYVSN